MILRGLLTNESILNLRLAKPWNILTIPSGQNGRGKKISFGHDSMGSVLGTFHIAQMQVDLVGQNK